MAFFDRASQRLSVTRTFSKNAQKNKRNTQRLANLIYNI